jgi:MFS family permease
MTNSASGSLLRTPGLVRLAVAQLFVFTGSQMWFVALTWLLLELTNSGLVIGTVLMVGAIPRAMLMLVGGAAADRFSAQAILRSSALVMAIVVGGTTALIVADVIVLGHLYLAAAVLGAADAFFVPAVGSLIPRMVAGDRLNAANSFIQLSDMITQVVGPAAAGLLIAGVGQGVTFGINGALFAFGALSLVAVRFVMAPRAESAGRVLDEIKAGFSHAWHTPVIRLTLFTLSVLSLAAVGPLTVGGALLARDRLGGAESLGLFLGAFGAGSLVGVIAAVRARVPTSPNRLLIAISVALGLGVGAFAFVQTLAVAIAVAATTGLVLGFGGVVLTTLLQRATPYDMQGRIASLVMFSFFALDPVSQGLSGLLVGAGIEALFLVAGTLPLLAAVAVALDRSTRDQSAAPR